MKAPHALEGSHSVQFVTSVSWSTGRIYAEVPETAVAILAERDDLALIMSTEGPMEVSKGRPLGVMQDQEWADARQFITASYDGGRSNPAFHGHSRLVAGVIEPGGVSNAPCFLSFQYSASCQSSLRIVQRFGCYFGAPDRCRTVTSVWAGDDHATQVSAMILSAFNNGQGNNKQLSDYYYDSSTGLHNSNFTKGATAAAFRGALVSIGEFVLNGNLGVEDDILEEAVREAHQYKVDVLNLSWHWDKRDPNGAAISGPCIPKPYAGHEFELENAYDEGVFVVGSVGNNDGRTATSCNIASPADTIKVFAVSGLYTETASPTVYTDTLLDPNNSARGGAPVTQNGTTFSTGLAGVDVVVPSHFNHVNDAVGTYGQVGPNVTDTNIGYFGGVSSSVPFVASLALILKDRMLANGHTFVNSPGRLHAMMLGMADRHREPNLGGSTVQAATTADRWYGFGRMKMREFSDVAQPGAYGLAHAHRVVHYDSGIYVQHREDAYRNLIGRMHHATLRGPKSQK